MFLQVCQEALELNGRLISTDQLLYHDDLKVKFQQTETALAPHLVITDTVTMHIGFTFLVVCLVLIIPHSPGVHIPCGLLVFTFHVVYLYSHSLWLTCVHIPCGSLMFTFHVVHLCSHTMWFTCTFHVVYSCSHSMWFICIQIPCMYASYSM